MNQCTNHNHIMILGAAGCNEQIKPPSDASSDGRTDTPPSPTYFSQKKKFFESQHHGKNKIIFEVRVIFAKLKKHLAYYASRSCLCLIPKKTTLS